MTHDLPLGITAGSSQTVAATAPDSVRTSGFTVRSLPTAPELARDLARTVPARVGDPVDIRTDDGRALAPADLLAETIAAAVRTIDPASTVAGFPAWWSPHAVRTQRAALDHAGLTAVELVPEPVAAVRWLQTAHEVADGTTVLVYDLGATGLTVSVVGTAPDGGLRGESQRSTAVAGDEFDLLVMRYVLANAVGDNDFDPFDPAAERELSIVRERCRNAKEFLSGNTATAVPVRLPGITRDVRLVRDEVEDLFRTPLLTSLDLIREAMAHAEVGRAAIAHILLTGGGASIPLVTELISTEWGIPVLAADDPAHTSASGAALLAADRLAESAAPQAAALVPAETTALAAIPPDTKTPVLPELPQDPATPGRFASRRRVILIAAAAIAAAALATGTLALGTTTTPTTSSPAAVSTTTTGKAAPANASGGAVASAAPAANSVTTHNGTAPVAGPAAAASAATAPGTVTQQPQSPAAPVNSAQSPNTAAQQPVTVITVPAIAPPAAPTLPAAPTIPSAPLGDSGTNPLNQAGNTLGTVLQAPSRVLPKTSK